MSRPSVIPSMIAAGIAPEWFPFPESRVAAEILAMHREGAEINMLTVTARFGDDLSRIGGVGHIAALEVDAPSGGEKWYAEQLQKHYAEREATRKIRDLLDRHEKGECADLFGEAATMLHEIAVMGRKKDDQPEWKDLKSIIINTADSAMQGKPQSRLYPTGLDELDSGWGGYPAGLITVSGPTGGGKSVLLLQSAMAIAEKIRRKVLIISLEMEAFEIGQRAVAQRGTHMSFLTQGAPLPTPVEFSRFTRSMDEVFELPIVCRFEPSITFAQIRALAETHSASEPLGCVMIDYLQLVTPPTTRREEREEQALAQMAREAKVMAGELKCPVLMASQINDDGKLSKARAIGHHSDVVLSIQEDGRIFVAKWRNARQKVMLETKLNGPFVRFERK